MTLVCKCGCAFRDWSAFTRHVEACSSSHRREELAPGLGTFVVVSLCVAWAVALFLPEICRWLLGMPP